MRSWVIWSKTFNCYSEFHASSETIIRQLPEKTVTISIYTINIYTIYIYTPDCNNVVIQKRKKNKEKSQIGIS